MKLTSAGQKIRYIYQNFLNYFITFDAYDFLDDNFRPEQVERSPTFSLYMDIF